MPARRVITYACEGCGREFESRIRRPEGRRYCGTCAEILRKAGLGPTQTEGVRDEEQIRRALCAAGGHPGSGRQQRQEASSTGRCGNVSASSAALSKHDHGDLTVEESVADPNLVDIGRALVGKTSRGLESRVGSKITDHLKNLASPHDGHMLNPAAKAAVEARWTLEVSWAIAEDNLQASAYESALIRHHKARYGRLPGFRRPSDRRFVRGNKQTPNDKGPVDRLTWSCWHPMVEETVACLPNQPGAYRIRALPPM